MCKGMYCRSDHSHFHTCNSCMHREFILNILKYACECRANDTRCCHMLKMQRHFTYCQHKRVLTCKIRVHLHIHSCISYTHAYLHAFCFRELGSCLVYKRRQIPSHKSELLSGLQSFWVSRGPAIVGQLWISTSWRGALRFIFEISEALIVV